MPNLNNQVSGCAIAFIDTQVENYQSLVAGVKPGTEVVVLDGNRDAIDQITQILALRTNIDSIHIVSHGAPGSLQLGDVRFSLDGIECDRDSLQQWFSPQTDSIGKNRPNILLYGCSVAAGETGKAFVKRLSELTGASVAASKNLTGSVAKGGDWELEVRTGKIETPLVFAPEVLAGYEYVLNSFGAATNFPVGSNPVFVGVGDFNGDGIKDLAVANSAATGSASSGVYGTSILLGNGTGSFGTATLLPRGRKALAVAKFNPDNYDDLVVDNSNGSVSIFLGSSTGFGAPLNLSFDSLIVAQYIAAEDFNGDGRTDLALASYRATGSTNTNGVVSILLQNIDGTFAPPQNFLVAKVPESIAVDDFDGNGTKDLAVTSTQPSSSNSVSILLGNGSGSFGAANNITVGSRPYSIAVGKFNNDSFPDLAVTNFESQSISILLGNGSGGFTTTEIPVGSSPSFLTVADLNGDSKQDLAVVNNNKVSTLLGNGDGTFTKTADLDAGSTPSAVTAKDLNGDGLPDLAVTNFGSDNVSILVNTPNTVNFGTATYSGTEGTTDTVVNIPVTLSAGTPFADVTVPIAIDPSSSATQNSDYTISPTSITFPAGATGAALTQNVAVTIKPDNLPENTETAILNFGTITGGVAGTTKQTTLNIAANGSVSYAVAADIASIPEGNSGTTPLTFTVTRSGGTGVASSVNYAIGGTATNVSDYNNIGGTSGATGISGTINFAVGETSKTITLNVVGDGLVEPDETVAVTLSNPVAPGPTPTFTAATATTTIKNDDTAGFSIAPTNITATEGGATGSYKVKLTSQPTAPVNISFNTGNAISPIATPITFDSTNWNVDQTVTVSAIDDNLAQGTHSGTIAHTVTSTDASYNAKAMPDVTASITDNDSPGVSIVQSAGSTNIAEGGATATYGVVLTTAPAANVTINFDTGTQISAIAPLTFTPSNWNVAQNVTVSAIEDSIAQGTRSGTITHTSVSTDTLYNGLTISPVTATIADNDTAGVSISPTSTTATEGGAGTYRVKLKSQPIAPVTVSFATGDQINAIAAITFDSTNWNVDRTVTVSAIDDSTAQGTRSGTIAHTSASTDTKYNALTISPVTATIADNDTAGVSISPTSTTATEGGATGSYSVQLTSVPSAPVTISFANGNQINAIADVTFDSTNWNVAKPVTVTATDDAIVEGNHTGSISHTAQSADTKYSAIGIPGVTVAIADNDVAPTPTPVAVDPVPPTPVAPTPVAVDPVPPTPVAVDPVPPTPVAPTPVAVDPIPPTPIPPTPVAPTPVAVDPLPPTPVAVDPVAPTPVAPTPVAVDPVPPTPVAPTPVAVDPIPPTPVAVDPIPPTPVAPTPVAVDPVPPTPVAPTPVTTGTGGTNPFPIAIPRYQEIPLVRPRSNARYGGGALTTPGFVGANAWGDYDNDGDLDLLVMEGGSLENYSLSFPRSQYIPKVYSNEREQGFKPIDIGLPTVYGGVIQENGKSHDSKPSATWGDSDNDGDLDILLTGVIDTPPQDNSTPGSPYTPITRLYRNQRVDSTLPYNPTSIDPTKFTLDTRVKLPGIFNGSAAWGDYNNDGRKDLVLTGDTSSGYIAKVFRNEPIGFNNGSIFNYALTFEEETGVNLPGVIGNAAWGDYNNDGKPDILLAGDTGSAYVAKLYRNTGNGFTEENKPLLQNQNPNEPINYGAWGDSNSDGQLDILLTGTKQGPSFTRVLLNKSNYQETKFEDRLIPSGPDAGFGAWGDEDNDGDLDILLTERNNSGGLAKVYQQDDLGSFKPIDDPTLPNNVAGAAASWGDYNNDGRLDIALTTTDSSGSGSFVKIYRNDTPEPNTQPSAPEGLNSHQITQEGVILSLPGGLGNQLDAQTPNQGLSYNLRVWTTRPNPTPGGDPIKEYIVGPMSLDNGTRQVVQLGNVNQANSSSNYYSPGWLLKPDNLIPGQTYYWSVQAIDSAWAGSPFSEVKSFVAPDIKPTLTITATDANAAETRWEEPATANPGKFTITRTGGNLANPLNVYYKFDNLLDIPSNTAIPGIGMYGDYQLFSDSESSQPSQPRQALPFTLSGSNMITIPAGKGSVNIDVDVYNDSLVEGDEKVFISLDPISNYNSKIGESSSATVTIADNEPNYPPGVNRPPEMQINLGGTYTALNVDVPNVYTDPDGDLLTYTLTRSDGSLLQSNPNSRWLGLSFNSATNTIKFTGTPPSNWDGFYAKLTATDPYGASASQEIHVVNNNGDTWVIDGYISGATVFLDANKNAVLDTNEPSTTTDSGGKFNLNIPFETFDTNNNGEIDPSEGNLVAIGGIDTATGLPLETPVTAPPDASVVTLLTTLIADLIDKGIEPESAQSLVKAALSLPADVDLTSLDPIEATNNNQPGGVQVLAAMVKVQNFITQTSALIDGASSALNTDIVKAVVSSMTAQIQSGTVLNLSNAAALEPIIQQTAAKIQQIDPSFNTQQVSQITSQSATVMATANQRIDTAVSNPTATSIPESLARLQQVALGPTTQDFKEVGTGNKPIYQLVADNTGTALDSRIEAVILPAGIATPVVSGDADLGSNSPNAILGTNGDDILTGDSANNVLMGMRGNDSLDGNLGNDTLLGGKGSDTILGSSGDDALFGNRGADILNGDDGNDILYGGKGDDLLNGGLGIDSLIGGMGVDKFLLSTNSGTDTITDFEVGQDLLVLGNGLSFSQLAIAQDSGATLIRFAQTGEILASLNGVSTSSISAVNFGLI
ncbi:DUF4347 domain-containing protein [Microcoleus sp. BROC3]|uniref:DUF4347 domain-containing protein n=1 Tax=Microcoleus sp. BROC3 TaxID=3055323 RepID=UPI002FD55D06